MRRALLVIALCALLVPLVAFAANNDPVITVPADMTIEAQNFTGATVTYTASAVDRHGTPIAVTCTPASGTTFGFGRTTVTCTARDSEERSSTKRFHVTVVDTQPPVIIVPAARRVSTPSSAGAVVNYSATASDVVDGPLPVTCIPASGTRFPVGTSKVSCSASDRRSNASAAPFDVTVVLKRTVKRTAMSPRAGARITTPPTLRWRAARKARFYNVQLFRRGQKILSAWPSRPRLRLHARWRFNGDRYRLRPESYTWLVWPAYGPPAHPRFGKLLGMSSFVVAKH